MRNLEYERKAAHASIVFRGTRWPHPERKRESRPMTSAPTPNFLLTILSDDDALVRLYRGMPLQCQRAFWRLDGSASDKITYLVRWGSLYAGGRETRQ